MTKEELKQLHMHYQRKLDRMFSNEYKSVLIDIESEVFGEEFRGLFEQNMGRIYVHPKFNFSESRDYLDDVQDSGRVTELEWKAFDELVDGTHEDDIKSKKIAAQKKLLTALKSELSEEEAKQLQSIIDNYEFDGEFVSEIENARKDMDAMTSWLEGDSDFPNMQQIDLTILRELIRKYRLYDPHESAEFEDQTPAIKEYNDSYREISEEYFSNYDFLMEDLQDMDCSSLGLREELLDYNDGSFVVTLKNKKTGEYEQHVFINVANDNIDNLRGILTHEVLHAEERRIKTIDGVDYEKTGHNGLERIDDDGRSGCSDMSELLHTLILKLEILPRLTERGFPASDMGYGFQIKEPLKRFYKLFRTQILRSACQEDLQELLDIVGRENWENLIASQTAGDFKLQDEVVSKMEEHAKEHMSERIGKFTVPVQGNVEDKDKAQREVENLIRNQDKMIGEIDGN